MTSLSELSQRLSRKGRGGLSDLEMLQLALRLDAARAQKVIDRAGGLWRLVEMTPQALCGLGIGAAAAERFVAGLELQKRSVTNGRDVISCPVEAWPYTHEIRDKPNEHFCCLYLNARHVLIQRKVVSIGSVSASIVHPREVFEEAIACLASCIILAHNHPSGDVTPSRDDTDLTRRMVEAGRLLGIEVIDHLIVTATDYLSLQERGLM